MNSAFNRRLKRIESTVLPRRIVEVLVSEDGPFKEQRASLVREKGYASEDEIHWIEILIVDPSQATSAVP